MDKPVIKTENLSKNFFVGKHKIEALKESSIEVASGEFVVIFGPSGSGKTTLLSLLAGLDNPTSGSVFVRDTDIYSLGDKELANYRRSKIGVVFQQFNLVPNLSAMENVMMPLILSGLSRKESCKRAKELLNDLDLKDRICNKPVEMSGGEQQRVAIARAIASNPWILLVDEPTGNLDEKTGLEIMEVLKKINSWGRTIILVTHNPAFMSYAHRIIFMENGKITSQSANGDNKLKDSQTEKIKYFIAKQRIRCMNLGETLRLAYSHFVNKKLRTFLTILGVALGVGSIVTLVSLGIGLQQITANQLASFDSLVTVNVSTNKNSANELDDKTVSNFEKLENAVLVSPTITAASKATFNNSVSQVVLSGIMRDALSFEGVKIESGQAYQKGADGIVVSKAAMKNFDVSVPEDMIGKTIDLEFLPLSQSSQLSLDNLGQLKKINYSATVVGISSDELAGYVYMSQARLKELIGTSKYSSVKVKVDDRKNVAVVRSEIEKLGFSTSSVVDLIDQVDKVFLITQVVLGIIGGVALVVALIGIINIMTISLLERTHEVGILKAIGATNKDIRRMFQYEVVLYGLFGAVLGVGGSWFIGSSINFIVQCLMEASGVGGTFNMFVIPIYFAIEIIALTVVVSLMAGWFPARRAGKLSPMEALRYE